MTSKDESGFALVEAIAALAVAALAAAALMALLTSARGRVSEAQVRGIALRQAQVLLVETVQSSTPADLERRGTLKTNNMTWRRVMDEPDAVYPELQRVVVEVDWQNLQRKGVTRLEAYRTAPLQ